MADTLGVVLAGGLASRLPNKALLPIHNGVAIESSLNFLRRSPIKDICVVTPINRVIRKVLQLRLHNNLMFVEQADPTGVVDAMYHAVEIVTADRYVFTFCDNIYDGCERYVPYVEGSFATVRMLGADQARGLDKYNTSNGMWRDRSIISPMCLAGYLSITRKDMLKAIGGQSLVDFLNAIEAAPVNVEGYTWHDIGTNASYLEYLDEVSP